MEVSAPPHFAIIYPAGQHTISPPNPHQIHASMGESSWHPNQLSSQNTSPSSNQASPMFSIVNRAPDSDYPSPAASVTSSYIHHQQETFAGLHQSPSLTTGSSSDLMAPPFSQVESSIGPNRVLTRRQRAALLQDSPGRRVSTPSNFPSTGHSHSPQHHSALYLSAPNVESRPQTPINALDSSQYQQQRDRPSLNIASAIPMALQSPQYPGPLTPTSSSSPYSPYNYYPGNSSSNSTSNASHPRSASPALSNASALTSVSSSTSAPNTQTFATFPPHSTDSISPIVGPRPKQRKQRLFNVDRKAICLYHKQYPNARQEDIGMRYGVERSTISKILKHKTKWLNVPEHESMRIAKHRPSKFPEIEEQLVKWLMECSQNKTVLSDALIRAKAKETARNLRISDDKFKASSGWVENFKHRHGIRAGVWSGDGKSTRAARDSGAGSSIGLDGSVMSHFNVHPDVSLVTQNHCGNMDLTVAEESQEPEISSQENNECLGADPITLQRGWAEATNMSPSHTINPSDSSNASDMHDSISHSPLGPHHPHQTKSNALLEHHLTSHQHVPEPHSHSHVHHESQYEPQVYDDGTLAVYQPGISDNSAPSLADAEEAIHKLITFLDSTGRAIFTDQDRQNLQTIKCALFRAGSGVPYNREQ